MKIFKLFKHFRQKKSMKYVKELLEWRIKDITNEEELKKVIHDYFKIINNTTNI